MIFVVLGTQKFQFNRLLRMVDDMIANGDIVEEVFAQIGLSDYKPKRYEYTDFLNSDLFLRKINESSVLLTHSGVGTIISGINHGKPVVVVSRLAKYGEHIDDHQFQIAKAFSNKNYVLMCSEGESLAEKIKCAKTHAFNKYTSQRDETVCMIDNYLCGLKIR